MAMSAQPSGGIVSIVETLMIRPDRRLPDVIDLMVSMVVNLCEECHGVDGTGRPVETAAKCPHKSAPVLVAECAVK